MPKFEVTMDRKTTETTKLTVEAANKQEAEEIAYKLADHDWDLDWEKDDAPELEIAWNKALE